MAAISQLRKLVATVIGDGGLYQAAPMVLQTDGKLAVGLDLEVLDSDRGLILHDRDDDAPFRLKVDNGVLGVETV